MRMLVIAASALLVAAPAFAQDDEKAKLKKDILQKVEELIKAEEARILKSIADLLDRELGKAPEKKPDEPPKPEEKKPDEKKPDEAAPKRGYLGVRPGELTDEEREELKIGADEGGVKIGEIVPESAAEGKLEADDIILKIDDQPVKDVPGLVQIIQKSGAGKELTFHVVREGKRIDVKVKLGVHPEDQNK